MQNTVSPINSAQTVTYSTSTQSAALAASTKFVRLAATTDVWVAFGANPTATVGGAGCILIKSGFPELFGIGGAVKIAAIQDTAGGKLCITEGVQL